MIAGSIAAVWVFLLAVLSLTTANPVTLNREQIASSTDVLTAVIQDHVEGRIRVEKSWRGEVADKELVLPNLTHSGAQSGDRVLVPLFFKNGHGMVTPSQLPGRVPLVYPATPEAERQLRSLLAGQNER